MSQHLAQCFAQGGTGELDPVLNQQVLEFFGVATQSLHFVGANPLRVDLDVGVVACEFFKLCDDGTKGVCLA